MKHALVEFHDLLTKAGLVHGRDYAFMLNVHDEWQLECSPKHAEYIGRAGCLAITKAGEKLGVRLRLDGEYKVGNTWKETH
jgi:DNA polymerase-1